MPLRTVLSALVCLLCRGGEVIGTVKDAAGKPLAGALVALTPDAPNALSDGRSAARLLRADAKGAFRAEGLPAGSYGATAALPGYAAAFRGQVQVPAEGHGPALDFTLTPGGTSVEGRVVGALPKDLSGLRVYAGRVSEESGDLFYAAVDGDRFRLTLGPGRYLFKATLPGLEGQPTALLQLPGDPGLQTIRLWPALGSDPALAQELNAMAQEDQAWREKAIQHPRDQPLITAWAASDEKHLARLKIIVAEKGWPGPALVGPRAASAAWLLTQHGSPDFLKACLPFMEGAAARGELPLECLALSTDRVLVQSGRPQRYGSQFHRTDKGEWEPDPLEDPAHVDERRKSMGLEPLAEYKAGLIRMYTPQPEAN